MLGLTLAARHPEMVNRLVLSCFLARYDLAARLMRATWKRAARDSGMRAVADLTSVAGFARGSTSEQRRKSNWNRCVRHLRAPLPRHLSPAPR